MPHIAVSDLSYWPERSVKIFSGLSFGLCQERVGLVGDNGVGKTTLLRILAGEAKPTSGDVRRAGSVAYLPQDFRFGNTETVGEALSGQGLKALKLLGAGHLDAGRELMNLSGGEKIKIFLAKIMSAKPDFIILDEPTNNLDGESRSALYSFIRGWRGGLIVASHDRELLGLMGRILELSPLGIKSYGGNFDDYREQKNLEALAAERQLSVAVQALAKAKKQAQDVKEKRQKQASRGDKNRSRVGASVAVLNKMKDTSEATAARSARIGEKNVESKKKLFVEAKARILPENRISVDLSRTAMPAGKMAVKMSDVFFAYGPRIIFQNFSLAIFGPRHVSVKGPNGSGKTTLAKLVMGRIAPQLGEVKVGASSVAYLDQGAENLEPASSLLANFQRLSGLDEAESREALAHFLFRGDDVRKNVAVLSGGERVRAALACILSGKEPPSLLVLDEPSNNLDRNSIEKLESALSNYRGALIIISHDRDFLEQVGIDEEISL